MTPNLLEPYIKVTLGAIGNASAETFTIGDGKLVDAAIELGEGTLQSNCSFSIRDPDRRFLDKYLAYIESVEGLNELNNPNPTPEELKQTTNVDIAKEDPVLNTQPGEVIYASAEASAYGYGEATQGGNTGAYGDLINFDGLFAAMVNTRYKYASMRVTDLATNKSIVVKIIDRGPFAVVNGRAARPLREHPTRKIDLTRGAWAALTNGATPGIRNVKIEWLKPGTVTSTSTSATKAQKEAAQSVEQKRDAASKPPPTEAKDAVSASLSLAKTPSKAASSKAKALVGSQITVEMGFSGRTIAAYSFIHTGLRYSHFDPYLLEFRGMAASWVMTQRTKNTIYQNMTFRKVATKIASSYGLALVMSEEGPLYQYFPQRGQNDYEFLLAEARRLGYRVHTKGAKLTIEPRDKLTTPDTFVLEYGVNMGRSFEISHEAQSDTKGGARASEPGKATSTGVIKYEIDPDTGKVKQVKKESDSGMGADTVAIISGNALPPVKPRTDGATASADAQRKENEKRIKGIKASASLPTTEEALLITPDSPLQTKGISTAGDRFWVVDSVKHSYREGAITTNLSLYSPLRNKYPSSDMTENQSPSAATTAPPANATPFDPTTPKFIRPTPGAITSRHRTENPRRPKHRGIDYAPSAGTPVVASASGTVVDVITGCRVGDAACGGRYGNKVDIDHGGGWMTRYAHLQDVNVTEGQTIGSGQKIGTVGNTGSSTGPHLHFEIRKGNEDLNPRRFIPS